jgi:hypothetical protein
VNTTNPLTSLGGDVHLETLDSYDCWRLVTEAAGPDGIARVVWSGADGPAIVPMNFTVADGVLWFQTTPGSRLARECRDQQVLVEVDHLDAASHTGWSVVVTGPVTVLPPAHDPGILGSLQVWPRGPRQLLIKVEPQELTGRRLGRHG